MSKRITAAILIACMILSITACTNGGDNNRETTVTGDTKNNVNPDISEPNQSIASDALVIDPTTESTTESVSTGPYEYELYGKTFTISARIEDYFYTIDGSDYTYFDLDEFMKHFGLDLRPSEATGSYSDEYKYNHYCYRTEGIQIEFITFEGFAQHSEITGTGVCRSITFYFPKSADIPAGAIRGIKGNSGGIDTSGGVYDVNGDFTPKNRPYSEWCLTYSEIIVLAVILDCFNETGYTYACKESLLEIFDSYENDIVV